MEIEVLAVAVAVAGESRVEVDERNPEATDELVDGRAPQGTFVGQVEAPEVRVGVKGAGFELLAVVDDRLTWRAVATQEVVEGAEAQGVVRREVIGGTDLDGLGNVDAEGAQTETRPRVAGPVVKFSDL